MPYWVLKCPHSNSELQYSEINRLLTVSEYFFPRKPDFPMEGRRLECSYCKESSMFYREQLPYRAV
jgi:hypothetical protein